LGIVVPNLVLFQTLQVLPVGLVALIVVTVPLITVAICGLAGWERWSRTRIFGVLLGFFGAALILSQDGDLPPIRSALWISVALVAPLSLAVCGIYAARARPPGMTPVGAATGMLGMAAAILGPLAAATGQFHVPDAAFGLGQQAVVAQIVVSSFCYLLYFRILRTDGPVYFSQVGYVIVASGLIWGAVLYGEAPHPAAIAAGILIVLGLIVVHHSRRRPDTDAPARPGIPRPQFARSNSKQP
jgi:drug/metabolite transporter (DMT)-like permease